MGTGSSEGKEEAVFYADGVPYVPWDIVRGMIDSARAKAMASGAANPESMGTLIVFNVNGQKSVCLGDVVQFFASAPSCYWDGLPDVWKGEYLAEYVFSPPTCLAREQREAVARYLTTAPEIPRIVRQFPIGFGVTPKEELPQNWGADDLVRWICEKTDHTTGKRYLTPEGYQRARELYEPEDPMTAFFRTAPRLHTGGGALVVRGPYRANSLAELLRVQPDTRDWPALSFAQQDMCDRYIRPIGGHGELTYENPHPEILWTRYQVHTGALPADFDAEALVSRALEAGRGRVVLTPEALAEARRTGMIPSGFRKPPRADSGRDRPVDDAPEPEPGPVADKGTRTLAEELGVKTWRELHVTVGRKGLRAKRCGAPGQGRSVSWQELGWNPPPGQKDLDPDKCPEWVSWIGSMATRKGALAERNDMGRPQMRHRVNVTLCRVFGLPGGKDGNPLYYLDGHSRTRFVLAPDDEPTRDAPGKCSFDRVANSVGHEPEVCRRFKDDGFFRDDTEE